MKKLAATVPAASMVLSLFTACGAEKKEGTTETNKASLHTLFFRDSSKSTEVTATFFNSVSGKSEDVKMTKCGEDSDAFTFSCEGDTAAYNMAYISYDNITTDKFAFNQCVSGWYSSERGFMPYTEGKEIKYKYDPDEVTLTCNGYDKKVNIWKPDDYDPSSDEKYATIYLLDGQGMLYLDFPGETILDSEHAEVQVQSMMAVTGKRAIIVGIHNYGNLEDIGRDDELIPDLGRISQGEDYEWTLKYGGETSKFIADEVVPYVQKHYNVYTDAAHTSIAGKSLGGLESFYIAMEHPEIFGTAGVLSPSFWVYDDATWRKYLGTKTLDKNSPFLYFYSGNETDDTGKETKEMVQRIKEMGYPTDKFVFHYSDHGDHSVPYWRAIFSEFLEAAFFPEALLVTGEI